MKNRVLIYIIYLLITVNNCFSQISCEPISLVGCNPINNNNFTPDASYNPNNNSQVDNPFNYGGGLVAPWRASHGTPNIYDGLTFNYPPPLGATGYARMGSFGDFGVPFSEGIVQKIAPLDPGNNYLLSFFKKRMNYAADGSDINPVDNFYIILMHCYDYSSIYTPDYNIPLIPISSQIIYCERSIYNTSWEQVVSKFVPNDSYDMIWMFPKQNAPYLNSNLLVSFPEIIKTQNFSAGQSPQNNSCTYTIGPNPVNCSVANAQFTWTDPNGNIIYQGPNQGLTLNMATAIPGNYTLTMRIPSAVVSNSNCGVRFSGVSATVYVPPTVCPCTNLQILSPSIRYVSQNGWTTQNLDCGLNNLCYSTDEFLEFHGTSNQNSGNSWEIIVTDLITSSQFQFASDNGYSNPVSNVTSPTINFYSIAGTYAIVEVKLTNSILNETTSIFFRINPTSYVWDICYSSLNPGYKRMLGGPDNIPGNHYNWTFPSSINVIDPNVLLVEYSDANYGGVYPTTATLQVNNDFGCPSYNQTIPIIQNPPITCNLKSIEKIVTKQADIQKDRLFGQEIILYPNPATNFITLKSKNVLKEISVQTIDGKSLRNIICGKMTAEIDITRLPRGIYLIKGSTINGTFFINKFLKQ